jgi:hypothetical protein
MGVVYDCLWYWRQEFLGQENPYSKKRVPNAVMGTSNPMTSISLVESQPNIEDGTATTQHLDFDANYFPTLGDDAFYSEWNWSTNGYLLDEVPQELGCDE